jgi:hypothetical protein
MFSSRRSSKIILLSVYTVRKLIECFFIFYNSRGKRVSKFEEVAEKLFLSMVKIIILVRGLNQSINNFYHAFKKN